MDFAYGSFTEISQTLVYQYIQITSIVILYYDHLITLDAEIKYIWSRKSKKIAIAFLIMRYAGLIVMTMVYIFQCFFLILNNSFMERLSLAGIMPTDILMMATEFYVEALILWRIYALYKKNKRLIFGLFCLGVSIIVIAAVMLLKARSSNPNMTRLQRNLCYSAAWIGLFFWDAIMVALTIIKTYQGMNVHRVFSRKSMVFIIFKDGVLYFVALAISCLGNMFTDLFAPDPLRGCFSLLNVSMAINLSCRMIINVIQGIDQSELLSTTQTSHAHLGRHIIVSRLSAFRAALPTSNV